MDITDHEHGGEYVADEGGGEAADVLSELQRLVLETEWLALMIEWEAELNYYAAGDRTKPLYGVKTPMRTKTGGRHAPLPAPVGLAPAA
jgi:hypothetical protein